VTNLTLNTEVLPEPQLEFRHGQSADDPHVGLSLFGPFDSDLPSHPGGISYAVAGTHSGIRQFGAFTEAISGPIVSQRFGNPKVVDKSKFLWPPFPGFEAAYLTKWPNAASFTHEIDETRINRASRQNDPNRRAYAVVDCYVDFVKSLFERDERVDVVICVVPDVVYQNCRSQSVVKDGLGPRVNLTIRKQRRFQTDLFDSYNTEEYESSVDFRRQLKARVMRFGIPVQIILESTLRLGNSERGERQLTPLSDRAWNVSTAIYYKAGGKPWRLTSARDGVCYVGLAFRKTGESVSEESTACCAAQMFLDTGDGVIFRGEYGPWYSAERHEFHLSRQSARTLLAGVLKTYEASGGKALKEIFLHSRSTIDDDEFSGYSEACPHDVDLIGVRVRRDDTTKLYRDGKWPILRGTAWYRSETSAYLWGSGFKPSVLSYDGSEIPVPLRVDIQHGSADIKQVVRDILGLTKLNYNACRIGDAAPVTVGFSDAVGEILISNPTTVQPRPNFKFYI
jgi:hypothetical protein